MPMVGGARAGIGGVRLADGNSAGNGGNGPFGSLGRYLARAVALAGISKTAAQFVYDPFLITATPLPAGGSISSSGWLQTVFGSGAGTANLIRGGVYQLSNGGASSGCVEELNTEAAGAAVTNVQTDKWYMAARMKLTGGIGATSEAWIGIRNNAADLHLKVGAIGAVSTANWSVSNGPLGTSDKGQAGAVAINTNFHDFEMWNAGNNNVRWAIDGVEQTAFGTTELNVDGHPAMVVYESSVTVTGRFLDVDDIFMMFESAT